SATTGFSTVATSASGGTSNVRRKIGFAQSSARRSSTVTGPDKVESAALALATITVNAPYRVPSASRTAGSPAASAPGDAAAMSARSPSGSETTITVAESTPSIQAARHG